jgi:glycosyltransferase involved in cell wall biosynthesis
LGTAAWLGGIDRMKVLHVIPSLSPSQGGPSAALPVMERALSLLGMHVESATTDDDGPYKRLSKRLGEPIEENGVTRWYFPKQKEFYKVSLPFRRWLQREIHRFDIVHIHALFSFTSVMAARIARRERVPYVIRPLGVLNRYGMTQRRALLKRISFRSIEGPLLRDAAAVHFTSYEEQAEAETLGVSMRSSVIALGIEFEAPGNPEDFFECFPTLRSRQRILFLSRIDPKKNLEGLLRALVMIAEEFPGISLIVAGDGQADYLTTLKQLAVQLGIEERVIWAGRVDGSKKAALLAAADLFVLPSYSENFGIAAIEALAAGLPCILGKGVAVAADVEADGAGVAVSPTPESIADGIRCYLKDDIRRQFSAMQARSLAESRYSTCQMGVGLLQLYQGILHSRFINNLHVNKDGCSLT